MKDKKYILITKDLHNSLIEFLDEIQFDIAGNDDKESIDFKSHGGEEEEITIKKYYLKHLEIGFEVKPCTNEKEEKVLLKHSAKAEKVIDDRLLNAYKRIRGKVANGLAVVSVERDACGGCFSQIPPQRQLDIQMHKKVIVCEHCGRIMVDSNMFEPQEA